MSISPFIIQDSIICISNSVTQKVLLDARGQNANYFPSKSNKGQIAEIDLMKQTLVWDDPKPYIIYGIVYLDHGCLEIREGTRLHFFGGVTKANDSNGNTFFYNDGRLIIGSDATLKIKGSKSKPVILEGVRLEESFKDISGQWSGLFIDKYSKGNEIDYTTIKNNLIGINFDSLSEGKINNCIFFNNTYNGIAGYSSSIEVNNCLFYNQSQSSVSLQCGGNYIFNYCTMANIGNDDVSTFVSNNFCTDFPFCTLFTKKDLKAEFTNCIFTSSSSDGFYISVDPDKSFRFDLKLDHCLLKIKDLTKPTVYPEFIKDYTFSCYRWDVLDSLFKNISKNDFRPDTLSILISKAIPLSKIPLDLNGDIRDGIAPDIGCYEHKY